MKMLGNLWGKGTGHAGGVWSVFDTSPCLKTPSGGGQPTPHYREGV